MKTNLLMTCALLVMTATALYGEQGISALDAVLDEPLSDPYVFEQEGWWYITGTR